MRKGLITVFFVLCIFMVFAQGKNITMSTEHSDYYFALGEDATVPVNTNNSFDASVTGMLTYRITQQINQNGYYMSSTRMNSASATINTGLNTMVLDFGSSDSPGTVSADLQLDYTTNSSKTVYLKGITVHFVSNSSQQSSGQQVSSTSQQNSQQNSGQQGQQNQNQQNQQNQNQQNQQNQNQQNQQNQNNQIYNKLQQNQMAQDSSALKKQMKESINERQQMEKALQDQLQNNAEVSQAMQSLENQGFNQSGIKLDPENNNSGTFNMSYISKNGSQASLQGRMDNGTLTKLEEIHPSDKKKKDDDSKSNSNFQILVLIALVIFIILFSYFKKKRKDKLEVSQPIKDHKEPFDYVSESKKLLELAKELFSKGNHKEAYTLANRSLRIYLTYKHGLDGEITNDDLIGYLQESKISHKVIKECFDLCSLVEFAKYKSNQKDFGRIVQIVQNTFDDA